MSALGDVCAVALAEVFRGDGRIVASPMGALPRLGARLAKATFAPELVLTDGLAAIVDLEDRPIGWMPYERIFDVLWSGRRHVLMGATQLDRHGNQNLSCLGSHARPKVQLLGARGAPGNTVHHPTSYWIPSHTRRVFVERVDFVSGVGPARGACEIRRVVTNLAVLDLSGPDATLAVRSLHPGVALADVREATGCALHTPAQVPTTRGPTPDEAAWLERLDPQRTIRGSLG